MPLCKNCHQSFEGKYCSYCGQRGDAGRLSLHEVYHDVVHSFSHADKGVVRLLKDIFLSPGLFYQNYFAGKRKTYFSPVTFFLLGMGLLIFFGNKLVSLDSHVTGNANDTERVFMQLQKLRYLVFIPVISLLTWAMFYQRYNLAECIAFWFFCCGAFIVIELASYAIQFAWIKQRHNIRYVTDWLIWLFIVWHIFLVFGQRRVLNILKCILLGLSVYFVLVYIYKLLGYLQGYHADFSFWNIIKAIFN